MMKYFAWLDKKVWLYWSNDSTVTVNLLPEHKNKYTVLYLPEKLKSLERTTSTRKDMYEYLMAELNEIKEKIKASQLNTLENSEILDKLSQVQDAIKPELGFTRAFLDEIKRQKLVL